MGVSLIDADKLIERLPKVNFEHDVRISKSGAIVDFLMLVLDSDVVDAAPVVHGKWEWHEEINPSNTEHFAEIECCGWRCGVCKEMLEDVVGCYFDDIDLMPKIKFCPNCGAKMDLEELR